MFNRGQNLEVWLASRETIRFLTRR